MNKAYATRLSDAKTARSNALWFRKLSRAFGFDEARAIVRALTRCGSAGGKTIAAAHDFAPMLALALAVIVALRAIAFIVRFVLPPPPPSADDTRLEIADRILPAPAACRA